MLEKIKQNKYVVRYRRDYEFRTVVRAAFSSFLTVAVGTVNLLIALFSGGNPTFLYTLAAYHYALALARLAVLASHRYGVWRKEPSEKRQLRDAVNYLAGGALLVLLTLIYSGIILLVTLGRYYFEYNGAFVYFMALYAFWKVIASLVNVVRYKKYKDFTVQTLRNIDLADGVVSVIALQSAILHSVSAADGTLAYALNAAVGGVAGIVLLALGSYMIVRGYHRFLEVKTGDDERAE